MKRMRSPDTSSPTRGRCRPYPAPVATNAMGFRGGSRVAATSRRAVPKRKRLDSNEGTDNSVLLKSAYSYLNRVRLSFADTRHVYSAFTHLLKEFKDRKVAMEEVVNDVADLFRAYPALLEGFAIYLPRSYRMLHDPTALLRPRPPFSLQVVSPPAIHKRLRDERTATLDPNPPPTMYGLPQTAGAAALAFPFAVLAASWVPVPVLCYLDLWDAMRVSMADKILAQSQRRIMCSTAAAHVRAEESNRGRVAFPGGAVGGAAVPGRPGRHRQQRRRRAVGRPDRDPTLLIDVLNGVVPLPMRSAAAAVIDLGLVASGTDEHGHHPAMDAAHRVARRSRLKKVRACFRTANPESNMGARVRNLRRAVNSNQQPSLATALNVLHGIHAIDLGANQNSSGIYASDIGGFEDPHRGAKLAVVCKALEDWAEGNLPLTSTFAQILDSMRFAPVLAKELKSFFPGLQAKAVRFPSPRPVMSIPAFAADTVPAE